MQKTNCPITNSLKLIGGKWKIAIIYNLMKGPTRFGELKKVLYANYSANAYKAIARIRKRSGNKQKSL